MDTVAKPTKPVHTPEADGKVRGYLVVGFSPEKELLCTEIASNKQDALDDADYLAFLPKPRKLVVIETILPVETAEDIEQVRVEL